MGTNTSLDRSPKEETEYTISDEELHASRHWFKMKMRQGQTLTALILVVLCLLFGIGILATAEKKEWRGALALFVSFVAVVYYGWYLYRSSKIKGSFEHLDWLLQNYFPKQKKKLNEELQRYGDVGSRFVISEINGRISRLEKREALCQALATDLAPDAGDEEGLTTANREIPFEEKVRSAVEG